MRRKSDEIRLLHNKNNAVDVEDVCKSYDCGLKKLQVLNNINLTIQKGSIYGLLGPSGCGKTTLLRLMVGILKPDSGSIRVFGNPVGNKESGIPGPNVGYMPQELALNNEFTIKETMSYFGHIYSMNDKEIDQRTTFLIDLLQLPNKSLYIKNLSGGQKRRVSFAISLFQNASVLILDEPTVGVDPLLRVSIWDYLVKSAREKKISIIITTHYIEEVREANMVGMIRNGSVLAEDSPKRLLSKFQSSNLEDVFVKLCYVNNNKSPASSNITSHLDEDLCNTFETENDCQNDIAVITQESIISQNSHTKINIDLPEASKYRIQKSSSCDFCINIGRTKAVIKKNMIKLKRNIGGLIFQFIVPSMLISTFCVTLGQKPMHLKVGFVNHDKSPLHFGKYFVEAIDTKTISLQLYNDTEVALQAIRKNQIWGLIYLPANFSSSLFQRFLYNMRVNDDILQQSKIRIWIDQVDQQIMYALEMEILETTQKFLATMLKEYNINPSVADLPISFEQQKGDENLKIESFMIFLAPGLAITLSFFMALALTNLTFIIEKKDGLIERIYVAGVTNLEVMVAYFISQGFVMVVQVVFSVIVLNFVFQIPFRGSLFWSVALIICQALVGMFQGLFISSILDDENFALFLQLSIFFISILLSGTLWPIEGIPEFLRPVSYIMPQTLPAEALRALMLRGWGIGEFIVIRGFLVSFAWIASFIVLTIAKLKYDR